MPLRNALERRPWLLLAAAVPLQWLSTLAAGLWSHGEEPLSDPLVLANVLVAAPLALAAAYVLTVRLGGVPFAAWALAVLLASPWLLVGLALRNYDDTAQDALLPLLVGLTADPEFIAGTAVLGGAALLSFPQLEATVAAGAAFGLAALVVSATLAFPFAALLATLVEWRPRRAAALAAAVAPFAVVAALRNGFGGEERSYDALVAALDGFREYFWSKRLLEWLPVAGAIGLARLSLVSALTLGGGFLGFAVVQASRLDAGFEEARVFVLLLPGLPAYAILTAALPLLVPTLAARLPAPATADLRL
jgi:hypothetical protein